MTCCRDVAGASSSQAAAKADAYLAKYAANFGARPGELKQTAVKEGTSGWTITYQQSYKGVPVFGGTLKANVDAEGDLTAGQRLRRPRPLPDVTPGRPRGPRPRSVRSSLVKAHPPTAENGGAADLTGLRAASNELVVYREGAVKGDAGKSLLAYQVEVTNVTKAGRQRPGHGVPRRHHPQAGQPLLAGDRRARALPVHDRLQPGEPARRPRSR